MERNINNKLADIVYERLKNTILMGEIVPGARLLEGDLAKKMDVSRTPVREAIRKLEKEGLVTILPRRGAYASDINFKDIEEALEVKRNIDGLAALYATKRITPKKLLELKEACLKYDYAVKEKKIKEMIMYDAYFHSIIAEACGNKFLAQMIQQLQERDLRYQYIYYKYFSQAKIEITDHESILNAIEQKNAEAAQQAAKKHVDNSKYYILDNYMIQKAI